MWVSTRMSWMGSPSHTESEIPCLHQHLWVEVGVESGFWSCRDVLGFWLVGCGTFAWMMALWCGWMGQSVGGEC